MLAFLASVAVCHFDLKLHYIAAFGRADDSGSDIRVIFIKRADISRITEMVLNFFAVSHGLTPFVL